MVFAALLFNWEGAFLLECWILVFKAIVFKRFSLVQKTFQLLKAHPLPVLSAGPNIEAGVGYSQFFVIIEVLFASLVIELRVSFYQFVQSFGISLNFKGVTKVPVLYSAWNIQCDQIKILERLAKSDAFVYLHPLLVVLGFEDQLVLNLKIKTFA